MPEPLPHSADFDFDSDGEWWRCECGAEGRGYPSMLAAHKAWVEHCDQTPGAIPWGEPS